jgi:hypothetical protein
MLVQDLSAATDLVTALGSYESELVLVTGTLRGSLQPSGTDHSAMRLITAGVDSPDLVFRAATTMFAARRLVDGCVVTVGPAPLWRKGPQAQVQAYEDRHLTVRSCPP